MIVRIKEAQSWKEVERNWAEQFPAVGVRRVSYRVTLKCASIMTDHAGEK